MPGASVFTFPNRILFGDGAAGELASELTGLGVRRPLVVTDAGLVASGLVGRVVGPLGDVPVFDAVQPNPTEADVLAGLDRYREAGCDGLVGLGGGSPIDCAEGDPPAGDPSRPARRLRLHDRRAGEDHARPAADDRRPDHRRDGLRGRPRRLDPAPAERPQDDRAQSIPAAERRDLRPDARPRPAADADGRDGHGRGDPLRRKLPLDDLPPDLRRHRAGGPAAPLPRARAERGRRERPGCSSRVPDGLADGRDQLPQGAGRGPRAVARSGMRGAGAPRDDQRDPPAACPPVQPRGGRGADGDARVVARAGTEW